MGDCACRAVRADCLFESFPELKSKEGRLSDKGKLCQTIGEQQLDDGLVILLEKLKNRPLPVDLIFPKTVGANRAFSSRPGTSAR